MVPDRDNWYLICPDKAAQKRCWKMRDTATSGLGFHMLFSVPAYAGAMYETLVSQTVKKVVPELIPQISMAVTALIVPPEGQQLHPLTLSQVSVQMQPAPAMRCPAREANVVWLYLQKSTQATFAAAMAAAMQLHGTKAQPLNITQNKAVLGQLEKTLCYASNCY